MTDAFLHHPPSPGAKTNDAPDNVFAGDIRSNRFTEAVLERHKREGLVLAVKARWVALAVVGIMIAFLNPRPEVIYYEVILALLAFNGWLQYRFGRVGLSRVELVLLGVDLILTTVALVVPSPFDVDNWPPPMIYHFGNFIFFFVILAAGTLSYSWRTIMAIGHWTAGLWAAGAAAIWYFSVPDEKLGAAAKSAFGHDPYLLALLDPNSVKFDLRAQEIIVFVIVAYTLALTVRRFNRLLLDNAALERERTNLSRYFSPRVVAELSHNDEPLKEIRELHVAVLFVDIAGFTSFAAERTPQEVIATLRRFHGMMETRVFSHDGTLDKFLGDGLMATFGTPFPGPRDASNALAAVRAMMTDMKNWNAERASAGEPPIDARFGLHYGPVVRGDIGATQMEFAAIGNTVNVASRLEALTRELSVTVAMSADMHREVVGEAGTDDPILNGFGRIDGCAIRGLPGQVTVWSLA